MRVTRIRLTRPNPEMVRKVSRIAMAVLGAFASVGVIVSLFRRRRQIVAAAKGELPVEEAAPEAVAAKGPGPVAAVPATMPEVLTVDLEVDNTLSPEALPRLVAGLKLLEADRVPVRHVCLMWNGTNDDCCAHVQDVTTQSYMLSVDRPRATYVFDACAPIRVEEAMAAKDLRLEVYSAGSEAPVYTMRRRILLRYLERWLTALNSHYAAHGYDRSNPNPAARVRRAA